MLVMLTMNSDNFMWQFNIQSGKAPFVLSLGLFNRHTQGLDPYQHVTLLSTTTEHITF